MEKAGDATFQGESNHLPAIACAAQGDCDIATEHIERGLLAARTARDAERDGRLYVELAKISVARGEHGLAVDQLNTALPLLRNASEVYFADARVLLEKLDRGEFGRHEFAAHSI